MEEQIQRQSHIILQLRQKSMQQSVEDGASGSGDRRARYLEVENQRLREHVGLLEAELGGEESNPRPASAESSVAVREQLQVLRLQIAQRDKELSAARTELADTIAAWEDEQRITSQALEQNEALKREIQRLRHQ